MIDSDHVGRQSEGMSDDNPITLAAIGTSEMDNFLNVLLDRSVR